MQHQHQQGAPLPPAYGPGNPLSTGPFPPHMYPPQGPMPPADDGWGKVGVLMVVLALTFAGGVAYFIATSESTEAESAAAASEAAADEAAADDDAKAEDKADDTVATGAGEMDSETDDSAAPKLMSDGGVAADLIAEANLADAGAVAQAVDPADAGPDPLRANGEVDRPPGLISMSIESEPPGAQVIRKSDGVRLGLTPYRYEVESAAGSVVFLLKLEGHKTMSLPMPADRDSERQVMLFPGSGGAPVPVAPEQTALVTPPTRSKEPPVAETKAVTAPTTQPSKPKKIVKAPQPKKPTQPKRPKKVVKPKKSRGTVDYNAQAIPLD